MNLKAVIFDMDGVLVDSEGFWAKAEREVFSSYGALVTDELAAQTKYMTTKEVTEFWYGKFPWENLNVSSVEEEVVSKVIELIQTENCTMSGVQEFIKDLKSKNYKIGLATNAPLRVADAVLEKLQVRDFLIPYTLPNLKSRENLILQFILIQLSSWEYHLNTA